MKLVLTGYATVDGHFVSKKHVEKALEADGHEVLSALPKDGDVSIAQGTLLGGKKTSMLLMAEQNELPIVELGELISTPKAKAAIKQSLTDAKGSLDPQELRALEVLQSERKPAAKKASRKKKSTTTKAA